MTAQKIAVVIPAYKVSSTIRKVILTIPQSIGHIIVVDDCCPESSGKVAEELRQEKVTVLYHTENQGVGGATIAGYKKALELGYEVVVKMDGDLQMDPRHLPGLIEPILKGSADYTKGNRFRDFTALKSMPALRVFGNSLLSFLVKLASGYWNIMDPTNGYTAVHRSVLQQLDLGKISKRFFFESDVLIHLNIIGAVVRDIGMPARYHDERSSLKIPRIIFQFPPRLLKGFLKRIFLKYFIYDFNMASVYILIGLPLFSFSLFFAVAEWIDSVVTGIPRSAGTIMLLALPIIVSFQMLLQAVQIDIASVPRKE